MTVQDLDNLTVGQLVTQNPTSASILEALGIDYCCGGKRPLLEACQKAKIEPEQLLKQIHERQPEPLDRDWRQAPLKELAEHIVATHHGYLRRELPLLRERMQRVVNAHGQDRPSVIELAGVLDKLADELLDHLDLEENVAFPFMTGPAGHKSHCPVAKLEQDHDDTGALLGKIRQITDAYQAPPGACTTFRALYAGLEALEKDVHQHIHLENNILFPRALAGGAPV